jgi:prefoldin subunit 5
MMEEALLKRKTAHEGELGQLCYERMHLARDIDRAQARIEAIDARALALEAAVQEVNAALTTLKTQAAIDSAKEGEPHAT